MPKLGFVEQMIYALGYLLILAVLVGLFWFRFYWIEDRMMAQPGAVAYEAR
jgi:signal peptidase I